MEPIDYGGVLLRRWWVPVVLGVICAVLAVLLIPGASKPSARQSSRFLVEVVGVFARRSPSPSCQGSGGPRQ